jgi:signal transduction histidine kinase
MNDLRESALKIQHHSQRADGIIDSMLMHSRQTSGEREETDLNMLVKKSLDLAYHGMRVKDSRFKVTCQTVLDPALPPVSVIQADISRVLINILSNSFYAVRQRQDERNAGYTPQVKIQTRPRGENVEVVVHDNGTGIAPELVSKIYTPFFTTKPAGQGTGLGLSISHDIIHGYKGEIRLDTALGEFAEFTIVLPRSRRER